MMRYGYGFGDSFTGGAFGIMMMFFWLLVIVGIVLLIVWAVRHMSGGQGGMQPPRHGRDEACEIARTRYAKGEITKEQYDEMCRALGV